MVCSSPRAKHGLEDRGGVDSALGRARTHEGVQLVDEQDDVAAGVDLLENLLQALFEVTAVAAAGDERPEVERVQLLVLEGLGDLTVDDLPEPGPRPQRSYRHRVHR